MEDEERTDRIYETLGLCGCGIPDEVVDWATELLRLVGMRTQDADWGDIYDKIQKHMLTLKADNHLAEYIVWYWLDSRGLIEHGTGIGGSWLKPKGRELLAFLEEGSSRCS